MLVIELLMLLLATILVVIAVSVITFITDNGRQQAIIYNLSMWQGVWMVIKVRLKFVRELGSDSTPWPDPQLLETIENIRRSQQAV